MATKRPVTLRDVARAAEVSVGTVSHYLNGTAPVHKATQQKIQEVIDHLGYRRNEIASSLRSNRTRSLGMIVPNVSNPFYAALFQAAEEEAQKNGYSITLGNAHYNPQKMDEYMKVFTSKRMDGILLSSYGRDIPDDIYAGCDPPIVVVEPPPDPIHFPSIGIDNVRSVHQLITHLISRGHRRIAIIVPSKDDMRFNGYQAALVEHNLPIDPDLIYEFGHFTTNLLDQGAKGIEALFGRTSFTACFASTDMTAIGAMLAAKKLGYRIPQDLAVAGFDDIFLASMVDPPLTTVAQPKEEMGGLGVQMLISSIKKKTKPKNLVLNTEIMIRSST